MRSTLRQVTPLAAGVMALAFVASPAFAQAKPAATTQAKKSSSTAPAAATSSLKWGPAPAVFPAGAKMAVESGDPSKSGEFVVRLSFPANYRIPPHWHPTDEHVTVRSGTFFVGMGDALDKTKTKPMAAGDTGTVPAKMHHFALTKDATVLSIRAEGPFAMTYVNPADDPQHKK
jgi:quercetin dioxygenase-like cupin family protein